jgi:pyruvate,water dikinase
MNFTKWLNETNYEEIELVGGKNASLGSMIQNLQSLNVNIPNGFVITTKGYDYFMKYNKFEESIKECMSRLVIEENLKIIGKEIRELIICGDFPEDFIEEIKEKYLELSNEYNSDNVDVAVRSSGSAEDMPDASFAGQQDTYLNVIGLENILIYIKKCFASLFNDRAISYRKSMNYDKMEYKLSVTIQKMVNSGLGSAGVAFSLDINSGFRDIIIINSSYGLGELVVSGNVKPDEFIISKKCLNNGFKSIINKKLGDKNEKIIFDLENGGIKYENINNG